MKQILIIDHRLPGMNEILAASNQTYAGKRGNQYNTEKGEIAADIIALIRIKGIRPVAAAHFTFTWIERNRQRDPDNIAAGKKFILDALVEAKILPNDGWSEVLSMTDRFHVDKERSAVIVEIDS